MRFRMQRVVRFRMIVCCLLTACGDSPTAPVDVVARRTTDAFMCVASGDDDTPAVVVQPSANQTCPPGFDLIVWW